MRGGDEQVKVRLWGDAASEVGGRDSVARKEKRGKKETCMVEGRLGRSTGNGAERDLG